MAEQQQPPPVPPRPSGGSDDIIIMMGGVGSGGAVVNVVKLTLKSGEARLLHAGLSKLPLGARGKLLRLGRGLRCPWWGGGKECKASQCPPQPSYRPARRPTVGRLLATALLYFYFLKADLLDVGSSIPLAAGHARCRLGAPELLAGFFLRLLSQF